MLFCHPNTVRYRLRQIGDLTGLTPTDARDAFTSRDRPRPGSSVGAGVSERDPELGERYVLLALRLARHDEGVLDAYFGPPDLAARVDSEHTDRACRLVAEA